MARITLEAYSELFNTIQMTLSAEQRNYYCNFARLSTVFNLIKKYISENARVVDLACGSFIIDFLLESQGYNSITAIDREQCHQEVYQQLRGKNLLLHTRFYQNDLTNYLQSTEDKADLVLLNDASFFPGFTLPEIVPRIGRVLTAGGYFIFDVWNLEFYQKLHAAYNLLYPQYRQYRKYRISEITQILNESGFEIEEITPHFSYKLMLRLSQKAAWYISRQSNTVYFVARRASEDKCPDTGPCRRSLRLGSQSGQPVKQKRLFCQACP
jgi:SAM-dependent methyltransferase